MLLKWVQVFVCGKGIFFANQSGVHFASCNFCFHMCVLHALPHRVWLNGTVCNHLGAVGDGEEGDENRKEAILH